VFIGLKYLTLQGQITPFGFPLIEHFSPEDYNAGILNYTIKQDHRGFILVGNNKGVLEYDGNQWRKYMIKGSDRVRSLFPAIDGKIYVGTQNELGYLWPDDMGSYKYHSLKHLIPKAHKNFDEIWNVFPFNEGVAFANVKGILYYDHDQITFTPFVKLNVQSFIVDDKIYNQVMDLGLLYLDKDKWVLTQKGSFFSDKEVRGISTYNERFDLISTSAHGIFLVGKHEVIPWSPDFATIFSKHEILVTKRLKDGSFAIGTHTDGLYLMNAEGSLIHHFTESKGLKSKSVHDVFEDSFGNLWVGQNNDIAKIEWNAPFRYLNDEMGLSGIGYAALTTENYTYLGTNTGLYYISHYKSNKGRTIKKVEGIEGQVYSVQEINGDILVGCHVGAYQIKGTQAFKISGGVGWWTFVGTDNPNIAIGGGYAGLFLLRKEKEDWQVDKHFSGFSESSRIMSFDQYQTLWMSHGYKGIYAFKFTESYDSITTMKFYDEANGFPSSLGMNVFQINDENIFTTIEGAYRYNPVEDSFLTDIKINDALGSKTNLKYLLEDNLGDLIFISDDHSGILKKNDWGYALDDKIFNKIHYLFNDDLEKIIISSNDEILFAARDGFIVYKKFYNSLFNQSFEVVIRQIVLSNTDSILFDGNFISNGILVKHQSKTNIPSIGYNNNSIRLSFSALEYDDTDALFRYRLKGYEKDWSEWTSLSHKEYTNLFEGEYSFEVVSKNAQGIYSEVSSYRFNILSPWYRSSAMISLYLFLILGMFFSLTYSSRKSKKIISKQENALIAQDRQYKEVSEKSQEEINQLKNDKLTTEIRHKKKQLASTTMHLLDKNKFLQNIQSDINELIQIPEGNKLKSKLNRIVKEIEKNKNEENHWDKFELHFNEVNDDFTKKLIYQFPEISPLEVRLSVYLKMNLSTKEIANLSHVSTRAIEMSRYRLRKKLGLKKEINLIDFLMKV
jgi:hypothetical protein|tara:strand:- start:1273 stop:4134 length:2862 start_codon:yes stop_codon:yes gene_type:complete